MSKHLVLDEDVHRALLKRKVKTGLNVKDIGNAILRSLLERQLVQERIGRKLVDAGVLTETEYEAACRAAASEISAEVPSVSALVRATQRDTLTTGSWELKELVRDVQGAFQVVKAWARDSKGRPFSLHQHQGTEVLVVVEGRAAITLDNEMLVLNAPGCHLIPGGVIHAVAPLGRDTTVIGVLFPSDDALHC